MRFLAGETSKTITSASIRHGGRDRRDGGPGALQSRWRCGVRRRSADPACHEHDPRRRWERIEPRLLRLQHDRGRRRQRHEAGAVRDQALPAGDFGHDLRFCHGKWLGDGRGRLYGKERIGCLCRGPAKRIRGCRHCRRRPRREHRGLQPQRHLPERPAGPVRRGHDPR